MSGTLQFDNVEVFQTPGVGTPFLELTSAPGVTGFRLYTEGSNLFVRDTNNNSTIFGLFVLIASINEYLQQMF